MNILFSNHSLTNYRQLLSNSLAFVPTMGALHDGHLSLVEEAKKSCNHVIVSIFVNPLQFNNSEDLKKYPRMIQKDLDLLKQAGVNAVFLPSYETIYPANQEFNIQLSNNSVESVFEGQFRPGHFNGVIQVLHRFFSLIEPDEVYFGQKDLQQCMVVKILIDEYFQQIKFNIVPTKREKSGLAMSSRNMRLTNDEINIANQIYQSLLLLKNKENYSQLACELEIERLSALGLKTEYLNYVNLPNMEIAYDKNENQAIVFAGFLGNIRLIDNLLL
jgi:pantoate--beta-alanine ligase